MKKVMLILGMLFFTFQLSFAQTELKKDRTHAKKEQWVEKLNLTEEQSAKFNAVYENTAKERKNIMQSDLNREAKKTRLKVINQGTENQLKSILDENQFSKYQEMKMKKKEMRKQRGFKSKKASRK